VWLFRLFRYLLKHSEHELNESYKLFDIFFLFVCKHCIELICCFILMEDNFIFRNEFLYSCWLFWWWLMTNHFDHVPVQFFAFCNFFLCAFICLTALFDALRRFFCLQACAEFTWQGFGTRREKEVKTTTAGKGNGKENEKEMMMHFVTELVDHHSQAVLKVGWYGLIWRTGTFLVTATFFWDSFAK